MKKGKIKKDLGFLASPFGLVIILTFFTFSLVIKKNLSLEQNWIEATSDSFRYWQDGFFSLLAFTMQMMMVLVFGYALAIYQPIHHLLSRLAQLPATLPKAALLVAGLTMGAGLLNWGFGLVIGAIFSRMVHESLVTRRISSKLELLAACGYLSSAVWHGGLSGSSLLAIAESGHALESSIGIIPVSQTIFSSTNLLITGGLVALFLSLAFVFALRTVGDLDLGSGRKMEPIARGNENPLAGIAGLLMVFTLCAGILSDQFEGLSSISLNWVIFLLFTIVLLAYGSWEKFTSAISRGLRSALDIFVQFPFYGGIMGLIVGSGLLLDFSEWTSSLSGDRSLAIFSFVSAATVNFFVPSGGGQWAIQGPLIMESARILCVPFDKMALVFAYGDEISNLLQPFWALPLLSISGVSVKRLLPYCLVFFLFGFVFLCLMIWFFV
ncbi:TIGR00366 family protein [Algoriphagus confluentis]|uniref:Short-chain fatty acid transporter n=1 Tax=Algoriphagus confluentis TaxID=1697556 RepID=A0ABQ6PRC7_9BACT|nr:short-chain fatty acid transporter [Algoriphagus confluentis]